jgi:hypothetical protein
MYRLAGFVLFALLSSGTVLASTSGTIDTTPEVAAPPELDQLEETFRTLEALARQRRQEYLARPIERLPSVYFERVLATREEPFMVLGRCHDFESCGVMELELRAIRQSVCRTYVILLDAELNQGYRNPERIYGSEADIVFLARTDGYGPYKLMEDPPQPNSIAGFGC